MEGKLPGKESHSGMSFASWFLAQKLVQNSCNPEQRSPVGPELAGFREGQSREVPFHRVPCLANTSPDPSNPLIWQEHFSKPPQSFLVSRTSCQPKYSLRMVFVSQTRLCLAAAAGIKETGLGWGAQMPREVPPTWASFSSARGCCQLEQLCAQGRSSRC